ncbi:S1 RNA-binding domain-containing protein [Pedobacter sp. ASV28]|uniref:S1 RNA-binding domain-containing protein n=1 Tax=Pedobacter sp. ASV28 TaxID=2795123 RepID=UPI0018ED22DF|nr:S1 RNA-binding domain-containing protein [Pedobacter sp. ASV28]
MNFILNKINTEIQNQEFLNNESSDLKENYRVRCEYLFILMLSYLVDKKLSHSSIKEEILKILIKPTLGSILYIIEKLDNENTIVSKNAIELLRKYNAFRIDTTGHGFTYDDFLDEYIAELNTIYAEFLNANPNFTNSDIYFVCPLRIEGNSVKGKKYEPNGTISLWSGDLRSYDFEVGEVYGYYLKAGQLNPDFFRLTPFIHIENDSDIYLFKCVEQKLTGAIRYNQIFKTNKPIKEWPFFSNYYQAKSKKVSISKNNTIVNIFTPNYNQHTYIELGENKNKVYEFLTGTPSKSSVCANLWGHGGVGKTATIQNIIEELKNSDTKHFNFIIFLTNKDRFYNVYKDKIETIGDDERIKSFEELVKEINIVLNDNDSAEFNENKIIDFDYGKMLIIIDDFETFGSEDKLKINDFINNLDPHHHKVIITTRSTVRVGGADISFNELNEQETVNFLKKIFASSSTPSNKITEIEKELNDPELKRKLKIITLGRPLRILQFEFIFNSFGTIHKTIEHFIKSPSDELNDFFYGRFYDYLNKDAQEVYLVMGKMTFDEDLISTISKVKYSLIWPEKNEDRFNKAIQELEKLRIIELLDGERFKVWDKDILKGMITSFTDKKDTKDFNKGNINQRIEQISGKENLYDSLLNAARTNKVLERSEAEIKSGFRQILNKEDSPIETRYQALFELANYYRINLGSPNTAYEEYQSYEQTFKGYLPYIKTYSLFCYENDMIHKSIDMIEQVLNKKLSHTPLKMEDELDFMGLLITRKKKQLVDQIIGQGGARALTKSFELLSDSQKDIKQRVISFIEKTGLPLFEKFQKHNFIDKGKKTNGATGLRHLADLALLMKKNDLVEEICNYSITNLDDHWKNQFKQILNQSKSNTSFKKAYSPQKFSPNLDLKSIDSLNKVKESLVKAASPINNKTEILRGEVTGIHKNLKTAFVTLESRQKKAVIHIDAISDEIISDINQFLYIGKKINVKVLREEKKGLTLSMKGICQDVLN